MTPTTTISPKALFTKYLSRGSSNTEVRALQEFLAKDPVIYPEAVISGYFGPATERAVKRLQVKYTVASAGIAGYGAVGPKTRALLNSLVKN
jgi:peptidoglycan hydrolase-like protein with peptidoglycan-binding domain